jgi:ATP-dependent DNA helicase RecQ
MSFLDSFHSESPSSQASKHNNNEQEELIRDNYEDESINYSQETVIQNDINDTNKNNEILLRDALRRYWGYSEFRPYQLEVCLNILNGKDSFVVMATGSGKSLTFQLPAIALRDVGYNTTTLVICPLVSLMDDQVNSLRALGISAGSIGGNSTPNDEKRAINGEFTVLYATPEKIAIWKINLLELLKNTRLICIAIDESHW